MQEVGSRRAFARLGHRLSRWVYVDRPAETAGECPYMHSFNAQRWYGLDVLVSERPNYREIFESSLLYFCLHASEATFALSRRPTNAHRIL